MAGCLLRLRVGRSRESPHCSPRGKLSPVFCPGRPLSERPPSTDRLRSPRATANPVESASQCPVETAVPRVQPRHRRDPEEPARVASRPLAGTRRHRGDWGARRYRTSEFDAPSSAGCVTDPEYARYSTCLTSGARTWREERASADHRRIPRGQSAPRAGSDAEVAVTGRETPRPASAGSTAPAADLPTEFIGRRRPSHGRRAGHAPSVRDLPGESAGRSSVVVARSTRLRVSGSGGPAIHLRARDRGRYRENR